MADRIAATAPLSPDRDALGKELEQARANPDLSVTRGWSEWQVFWQFPNLPARSEAAPPPSRQPAK